MIAQPSQVKRSVDVALWFGLTLLVCIWATCALQPRTAVAGYPAGLHQAPAREVTPPAVPVDEHPVMGWSARWHAPGETVAIPDSVAVRLHVGPNAQTRPLPPAVRHRVERVASHVLPCWPDVVDDVMVCNTPSLRRATVHPIATTSWPAR